MNKTNHGGKRKNAGAKKKPPKHRHQINIDLMLWNRLKKGYSTKEINEKIRVFLCEL